MAGNSIATIFPSDPNRSKDAPLFIDVPTPMVAPVSERKAADTAINNEIFWSVLTDTNINYSMMASVNNGVVTLQDASDNQFELQRVVNEMWQVRGVEQVRNEHGVGLASTLPAVTLAQ